ncbi:hypothetical protein [Streptomyces sp. NPDC056796]|uniref:hypothetical protein n=1 Tax=Streptomyces sp. NPDC056796 TaxID=3345947 RepID=UPI0036CBFE18
MKLTAKIATAVALGAAFLLGAAVETPEPALRTETVASTYYATPKLPTKPCAEDGPSSKNCYWDAAKRGNGKGYSYVVDARGQVTYLNPKLNDKTARAKFAAAKKRAGWEFWGVVFGHQLCWAKVGDTSRIVCFDGFRETS